MQMQHEEVGRPCLLSVCADQVVQVTLLVGMETVAHPLPLAESTGACI